MSHSLGYSLGHSLSYSLASSLSSACRFSRRRLPSSNLCVSSSVISSSPSRFTSVGKSDEKPAIRRYLLKDDLEDRQAGWYPTSMYRRVSQNKLAARYREPLLVR